MYPNAIRLFLPVCAAVVFLPTHAIAADFAAGDRVHIASANKDGTVLAVGQKMMDGGTSIKVHVDGAAYPSDVGIAYDSAMSQITVIGHGASPSKFTANPSPQGGGVNSNSRPPGHVAPSAASCQQAIRANYVATGDDQAINVKFSVFQILGNGSYESVYKGDNMLGARGHVMQALSIHAKYSVLTHFADINADDQLRTYDANFKCYNTATTGELIAEITDRLDGAEHATYIKKH